MIHVFSIYTNKYSSKSTWIIKLFQNQLKSSSNAFYSSNPCFSSASLHCSRVNPISISLEIFPSFIAGFANFTTHSLACSSNFLRSPLYSVATTASWGSLGSGAQRSACSESRAVRMVKAGDHSSLRMSRQIAPVWELILGCHILVSKRILGGLYGYSAGKTISIWKSPPW